LAIARELAASKYMVPNVYVPTLVAVGKVKFAKGAITLIVKGGVKC
jgi:hypothetical protein